MNVKNIAADLTAYQCSKRKDRKKYQPGLKRVSGDIYIDETVKVMNNMITQSTTAKVNQSQATKEN